MHMFDLAQLGADRDGPAGPYREFLRVPSLSAGLYVLPAGETDPQQPYGEDEVYYVAAGRGRILVGAEDRPVGPGTIVYVPAGVEHRFHTIAEELRILVFFAPAEYTRAATATPVEPREEARGMGHSGTAETARGVRVATPIALGGERTTVPLALLAVYVVWGSTYLAMRVALQGFPPFIMAGARFLVAGSLLLLYLRARGAPLPRPRQGAAAVLVGALLLVGGNGGVALAEQHVASGLAALGVATVPLWAVLFAGLWRQWPRRLEWAGLLLGFAGIVLLNAGSDLRANPVGALALLLAAASWALGSVWSRHLTLPEGAMGTAVEMLGGGVMSLLCAALLGEQMPAVPSGASAGALLYLVVFGSLIAFSSYAYLLRRVPPALATSYAYINPLVAVGLGAALAGERVTPLEVLAMPVILAGVGLVALGRERV